MRRRGVIALLALAAGASARQVQAHLDYARVVGGSRIPYSSTSTMEGVMVKRKIELHFQERFAGERIEILVNGNIAATFTATTRYQIGLAHIEELEIAGTDEVAIRIVGGDTKIVPIVNGITQYRVQLIENSLSVEPAREIQTYL